MAGGGSRKAASIDVPIKADVGGFSKGLKAAKETAGKFTADLTNKFSLFGTGIGDSISKARASLDGLGKSNVGQLAKGIGLVTAGVLGLVVAAGAAAAALSSGGLKRITALGETSLQLGVASDKLSELQFAAIASGASAEDLNGFLKGLNDTVHSSIGQLNPASEAFKRLGTSAEELTKLSPDQQFARIKAGFDALPDAASKASAAVAIGGEAGLKLFKLLGKSAAEFEALKAKSKSSGFTVSPEDVAKVESFNASWATIGATFEGLQNQLTGALAPAIGYVSGAFSDWFSSVASDSKFFEKVVGRMVEAVGKVADVAVGVSLTFRDVFAGIAKAIGGAIGWVARLIDAVALVVPSMQGVADGVRKISESVTGFGESQASSAAKAREAFEKSKPSGAINRAYDEFRRKTDETAKSQAANTAATRAAASANKPLLEGVLKLKQSFAEAIADSGLTSEQKQVEALKRQGASLKDVIDLTRQANRVREAGKRDGLAEELRESTKLPLQKLGEDLDRINTLFKEGKISKQQAILGAAQKTRDAGVAGGQVQFAGALQASSIEGRSYLLSQTIGKPESMLETAKQGLEATRQGNNFLGQILVALTSQSPDALASI